MRKRCAALLACALFIGFSLNPIWAATPTLTTVPSFTSPPSNWGSLAETHLLNETSRRFGHAWSGFVETGGTAPTSANLTHTVAATVAYPGGYPVTTAATNLTYNASFRNYVFLYSIDGAVAGDFTVPAGCSITGGVGMSSGIVAVTGGGSFVNVQCGTTREAPSLVPTNSQYGVVPLFYADTGAVAITAVVNQRPTSPLSTYLGVVNVRDFGARCDGATDDLTAFNNATAAARGGWTIFIPPCNNYYRLSSAWVVADLPGIVLSGAGERSMLAIDNAAGQHAIHITGSNGFKISDLTISGIAGSGDGIRVGTQGTVCVAPESCRGTISRIFVRGVGGSGIRLEGALGTTIISPKVTSNQALPFAVTGGLATPAATGITITTTSHNNAITIIAPILEGNSPSWGLSVGVVEGVYVYGGTIEGNAPGEVLLTGSRVVEFRGTYFETTDVGPSVRVTGGGEQITFDGVVANGNPTSFDLVNCTFCRIEGGRVGGLIAIGSASRHTRVKDVRCSLGTTGGFTDAGYLSQIENIECGPSGQLQQQAGKQSTSHVNFARNGGFERWASSSSLDTGVAGGIYGNYAPTGGPTIAREDTVVYEGRASLRITAGASEGGVIYDGPPFTPALEHSGKIITVTVWARAVSGTPSFDIIGTQGGTYSRGAKSTTTSWTKYSHSFPRELANLDSVRLYVTTPSGSIYFDNFSVTIGDAESYSPWDNLKRLEPEPLGIHTLTFAASINIEMDRATVQRVVLTGNMTIGSFVGTLLGLPSCLILLQDGTGGRTVTWPGNVGYAGGAGPDFTGQAANRRNTICFIFEGGAWLEVSRVLNMP